MNTLALVLAVLLTALAGGLVFYNLLPYATSLEAVRDIQKLKAAIARKFKIMLRYGSELGGYVHDTAMSQFIPPTDMLKTAGTWTDTVGGVANTYMQRRTAADATAIIVIPVAIPQNSVALKGGYFKSIDIFYDVTTAAMDAVTALITRATLPANGAAFGAVAAPAFTYDTGHDTAAERLTLDQHKMTLTVTTPFWMDDDDEVYVELTIDAALTSVFDLYGARANYTLRV